MFLDFVVLFFWHIDCNKNPCFSFFFLQCGEPNNVGDLQKQPFYRFIRNTYILHPIALGALLYAMGGFPYIVWGVVSKPNMFSFCPKLPLMFVYICDTNTILVIITSWSYILQGVRTVWVYHITWFVNSACHVWGKQAWNTGDLSRNNWYPILNKLHSCLSPSIQECKKKMKSWCVFFSQVGGSACIRRRMA